MNKQEILHDINNDIAKLKSIVKISSMEKLPFSKEELDKDYRETIKSLELLYISLLTFGIN